MARRLRVGVVGLGVGQAHVEAFQSLPGCFEVVALCDLDHNRARHLASERGIGRVLSDVGELCRLDDVDIVDICTPSHLHVEHTLQALDAGKHVVCEKPIAGSLKAVDELIAAEEHSPGRVMPVFQNQFGSGVQKLKLLIDRGLARRLYLATVDTSWRRRAWYYADWHGQWATELGGALVTLGIHAHDVLYCLCGAACRVFACTSTLVNNIETEDTVSVSLEMPGGALASLTVTAGSSSEVTRLRFCFSELSAESPTASYGAASDPWTITPDSPEAAGRIERALADYEELPEGFEGQFYRLHRSLRDGTALPVTLNDARASVELATAIYHSARTGEEVTLPIGDDHPSYLGWAPGK